MHCGRRRVPGLRSLVEPGAWFLPAASRRCAERWPKRCSPAEGPSVHLWQLGVCAPYLRRADTWPDASARSADRAVALHPGRGRSGPRGAGPGARIARVLEVPISRSTVLRLVDALPGAVSRELRGIVSRPVAAHALRGPKRARASTPGPGSSIISTGSGSTTSSSGGASSTSTDDQAGQPSQGRIRLRHAAPSLGRRTQHCVDAPRPPSRTRLRTARAALRDADHLGCHHPHEQAPGPERRYPSRPRKPAPTS